MSPRRARSQLAIYAYFHVCAKGNGGQNLFLDDQDHLRYLHLAEKYRARYNLQIFAYCLMTNHVHWLIRSPSIALLSKAIHAFHVAYVRYFNRRHERTGHLFQDRFSSWVVQNQEHLNAAREYIEDNPVKAGMVKLRQDYRWSSANGDGSGVTLEFVIG